MKPEPSKKSPHLPASKITRSPLTKDEVQGLSDELKGTSDRAAGIVAAAHLEVELERLLADRFIELDENEAKLIFGPQGGFLSAAMAKVRLAHALGIFGNQTKEACATIFDIRNLLAHAPRSVGFSTNAIKNKCDMLKIFDLYQQHGLVRADFKPPSTTREHYVTTVYLIIAEMAKLKGERLLEKTTRMQKELASIAEAGGDPQAALPDVFLSIFQGSGPHIP